MTRQEMIADIVKWSCGEYKQESLEHMNRLALESLHALTGYEYRKMLEKEDEA